MKIKNAYITLFTLPVTTQIYIYSFIIYYSTNKDRLQALFVPILLFFKEKEGIANIPCDTLF